MNTQERVIVREALATLRGLGFEADAHSRGDDLQVEVRRGSRRVQLRGEVRRFVRPFVVAMVALRHAGDEKSIVVSDYVTPQVADRFRGEGVQFVDGAGNAYLESSSWFVFVTGKRLKTPIATSKTPRVFSRGGLATTFAILSAPALVSATVRAIASAADVSVGTVAHTLEGLRELGFVEEVRRKRRLFHRDRLIDQWTEAYARVLYPKLQLARFASRSAGWWRAARIAELDAQWGGETAAAALHRHLIPERSIIYTDAVPRKLIAAERMRADDAGDVIIRRRFWNAVPSPREDVVPALLIYADLLVEGDARSVAAAKAIRDAYLR